MTNTAVQPQVLPTGGNTVSAKGNKAVTQHDFNVMALAYYELIRSSTTSCESALIQAKRLKANGYAQQQANEKQAQLRLDSIPKLDSTKHIMDRHLVNVYSHKPQNLPSNESVKTVNITGPWGSNCGKAYYVYKEIVQITHKNEIEVQEAQEHNQQIVSERQFLTQGETVLQNEGEQVQTGLNTLTNEASQTMTEGSSLMQMVQSLTFQALLRKPVQ